MDAVDVVVEEDVVEHDVGIPAVLHELDAGVLAGRVVVAASGSSSVIVFAAVSIDAILRISMLSVPWPAAIHAPSWNFATLDEAERRGAGVGASG